MCWEEQGMEGAEHFPFSATAIGGCEVGKGEESLHGARPLP